MFLSVLAYLFVCWLAGLRKQLLNQFSENSVEFGVVRWPRKKRLDFGGNTD